MLVQIFPNPIQNLISKIMSNILAVHEYDPSYADDEEDDDDDDDEYDLAVLKTTCNFLLSPPHPSPGGPGEGPDCHFPKEVGVCGRFRPGSGVTPIFYFHVGPKCSWDDNDHADDDDDHGDDDSMIFDHADDDDDDEDTLRP